MRLLVFGDVHATDGSERSRSQPLLTLQQIRVNLFFQDLRAIYDRYACEGVVDLGDTTDDRSSIPVPVIEQIGIGLKLIPDSKWNLKLIGNHEMYLRNNSISTRCLFEHKFTVVNGNQVYTDGASTALVCCSYPASYTELADWLTMTGRQRRSEPTVLLGHFQVEGCQMTSGTALTGVPRSALKHYKLCLLGHIHLPQSLGEHIHYVGSPFQQDWSETGQQKRVAILDTGPPAQVQWVSLHGYPEYRRVDYAQFEALTDVDEHRYRVVLKDHTQTERFFQHPRFHMAEAEYTYSAAVTEERQAEQDWTFEGTCNRYMALVPPSAVDIKLTHAEMLEIGQSIARGDLV